MQRVNRRIGRKGQGLVEYILILFLMGIGCLTAMHQLRGTTRTGIQQASSTLDEEFQP